VAGVHHTANSHTDMSDRDASDGVEVALSSPAGVDGGRSDMEQVAAPSHHLLCEKL
jgi:hypothetical protein